MENERGEEILDDTPVEVPLQFKRPPSIQELIALHVRAAMQVERAMGKDDEEDFDEGMEVDDIMTPYELHAAAAEADAEFHRAKAAKERVDRAREKWENKSTVNKDRTKEVSDGREREGGVVERNEVAAGVAGPGSARGKALEDGIPVPNAVATDRKA